MRVLQIIPLVTTAMLFAISGDSQLLKKVSEVNGTVAATSGTVTTTTQTISNAKNVIKGLLGSGKTKEANIIAVTGVEYGSEDLEFLKNAIKGIKGVKDVVTNYKDETITIMVKSKDNATELWDKIPQKNKLRFKLIQSDEKSILLEYKIENTVQSNINTEKEKSSNVSFVVNKNTVASSSDKNSLQTEKSLLTSDVSNIKASYFVHYDFNENTVHLESETFKKDVCSAVLGGVGKTLTVTFYNAETKTGISFTIVDILDKIKAKKYEFDSEKTNKEKATWENGTNTKQLNVVFQPGDNRRYQIQCSTDPTFQYQGSGFLNITKLNPNKGGVVEGEFQFSFPVYKIKDGPAEIQTIKSGKFRIAIQ